jgi:hypothetical protein
MAAALPKPLLLSLKKDLFLRKDLALSLAFPMTKALARALTKAVLQEADLPKKGLETLLLGKGASAPKRGERQHLLQKTGQSGQKTSALRQQTSLAKTFLPKKSLGKALKKALKNLIPLRGIGSRGQREEKKISKKRHRRALSLPHSLLAQAY